jgi:pimeloyl-ACP methyl ester carboxylesterase
MATQADTGLAQGEWRDHFWWSNDGVRLHTRIYDPPPGVGEGLPPVLCLNGLTRNARDFEKLAPHMARKRRVYAVEFRGRGESGFAKDPMTYVPLTYAQDVVGLLEEQGITRFATVGTSLGGLVTMLLAAMLPGRLAGAVLNDVGPEINPAGLERIKGYVGQSVSFPTWVHCARAIAEANADVFPEWKLDDWLVMAKRSHRLTREGRIVPDYDANIAQPFKAPGGEAGVDLWPAFDALAGTPVLVVRGALSDILADDAARRMVERLPDAELAIVPRVGHAPTLDEWQAVAAIDVLLDRVSA